LNTFGISHIGHVRTTNEDRWVVKQMDDNSTLLIAADGMGGEAGGEIAAEITVSKLSEVCPSKGDIIPQLLQLIQDADSLIYNKSSNDDALYGMGTTATCVLVKDNVAYWVHVGDSRLYLFRNNVLKQITFDQTMAQFLLDEGTITIKEFKDHHSRNLLDQCVGCDDCEPDTGQFALQSGDVLLLMTDGCHGEVLKKTMIKIMKRHEKIENRARALIDAALNAGGKDNVTIVMGRI